jgi:hypothetical protein
MAPLYTHWKASNPIIGLDKPLGLPEVEAHRICRQSANEGGKVFGSTHRPPLLLLPPQEISQVLIYVKRHTQCK